MTFYVVSGEDGFDQTGPFGTAEEAEREAMDQARFFIGDLDPREQADLLEDMNLHTLRDAFTLDAYNRAQAGGAGDACQVHVHDLGAVRDRWKAEVFDRAPDVDPEQQYIWEGLALAFAIGAGVPLTLAAGPFVELLERESLL